MNVLPDRGLYAITDCENNSAIDLLEKTEEILNAGAVILQYRNKTTDQEEKKKLAEELNILCKNFNVTFIINDDISLAKELKADGIHLGVQDADINTVRDILGNVIVGISCYNNLDRAIKAQETGADYIAFGSFYYSQTKPDAKRAKINLISQAKSELKLPIVAIGGITPENGKVLVDAGADFLAVIIGLYSPTDTTNVTKAYLNLFNSN
jgi:thiamine-phosphate pyrophosphorylase